MNEKVQTVAFSSRTRHADMYERQQNWNSRHAYSGRLNSPSALVLPYSTTREVLCCTKYCDEINMRSRNAVSRTLPAYAKWHVFVIAYINDIQACQLACMQILAVWQERKLLFIVLDKTYGKLQGIYWTDELISQHHNVNSAKEKWVENNEYHDAKLKILFVESHL